MFVFARSRKVNFGEDVHVLLTLFPSRRRKTSSVIVGDMLSLLTRI